MAVVRLQQSLYKKTGDVRYHITVPAEYVADKKWVKGQKLMVVYDKNGDLLVKEMPK